MSEEPDFYDDEDENNANNSIEENFHPEISEIKEKETSKDENCSFGNEQEREKSENEEQNISMSMVKKDPIKEEKKIPEKIFNDNYDRPSLNSSLNISENNSEDKEPNFYDDEEEIEVDKDDEDNNQKKKKSE